MTATTTTTRPAATAPVKIQSALYAVEGHAAQTVKQIMDATGLSRSTINATLAKLAGTGDVIRFDVEGTVTWALTPFRKSALKKAAKKTAPKATPPRTVKTGRVTDTGSANRKAKMTTDNNTTASTDDGTSEVRRPRGELKELILAKLASEGPMGTYAMHLALNVPHGSTYNTMVKMAKDGDLVRSADKPIVYSVPA